MGKSLRNGSAVRPAPKAYSYLMRNPGREWHEAYGVWHGVQWVTVESAAYGAWPEPKRAAFCDRILIPS